MYPQIADRLQGKDVVETLKTSTHSLKKGHLNNIIVSYRTVVLDFEVCLVCGFS
jgi:hypothetical protein